MYLISLPGLLHTPYRDNPDSYVWINIGLRGYGDPLNYSGYNLLLKRLAKKAGINKRVHPHLFRHSRCTILAQHLTEAQLEKYAGWVYGSDMSGIYIHLSGRDLDDAILRSMGWKKRRQSHRYHRKNVHVVVQSMRLLIKSAKNVDFLLISRTLLN